MKVLVIEDHIEDYELIKAELVNSLMGFNVFRSSSFADLKRRLWSVEKFDCMILDFNLPDADGAEVLNYLREEGIDVPIVILTGYLKQHDDQKIAQIGGDWFLLKDHRKLLPQIISRLVDAHRTLTLMSMRSRNYKDKVQEWKNLLKSM